MLISFVRTRRSLLWTTVALLATAGAAPAHGQAWSTRAPLPEARQEVAVAALDGRVYVIGGFRGDGSVADTVEVYDPATDSWSVAAPVPTPIHHTAAAALGGKLYVVGGWPDLFVTPLASVYAYDPALDSWSAKASMPTARGSAAVAVLDGKLYAAGGAGPFFAPNGPAQDFAVYDPAADSWTALPDMPTGRNHLAAAALGGRFQAVGGRIGSVGPEVDTGALEEYDPVAGSWSTRAAMPTARSGVAGAAVGRFLVVFGGEGNEADPDGIFDTVEAWDSAQDLWLPGTAMPTGRHGIGAALVNGLVHVPGGGPVEGFGVTPVHEVFDPGVDLAGICGDALLDLAEACDDGNTAAGDCCSPTCQHELGPGTPPCCDAGSCQLGQACGPVCFTPGGLCQQAGGPGTPCRCALP